VALDRTTPVKPPIVNKNMKPTINKKGTLNLKFPPNIVANQLNIFIPVGTAIIIVAALK